MPLEFESLSHGKIVFGFFNIETDLLLLNQYFFFAEDFCRSLSMAAEKMDPFYRTGWEGYRIPPRDIGNLMGAIHGVDFRGFIGAVYQRFPFPENPKDFKQKSEGDQTRPIIRSLLQSYGGKMLISLTLNQMENRIMLCEFAFDKFLFQKLVTYVWLGGLPRWKDDLRPEYVNGMKGALEKARHPLLKDLFLGDKNHTPC